MSEKMFEKRAVQLLGTTAVAALMALWSGGAMAQGEGASASEPIPEIIVTAERRAINMQEVPISTTVFTSDDIASKGVNDLQDIQNLAPSIAINTYNRSAFVNIRGVGIAQSAPTSNPGVAYYLDGVLIPHEQFIGQTFFDIESIEVLRGPQGTLTGQNSTGGALYVRSVDPVFGEFSGYVDQTVANYQWYRTTGAANLPLGDKAALRVAALYDTRGSFSENIGPSSSEPGSYDLFSTRANLALEPKDGAHFNLRFEYFDNQTDNNPVKNRLDAVTSDPFTLEEDGLSFLNQRGYRLSGEGRIDVSDTVQFRVMSSWQDGYTKDQTDGDRTATAPAIPIGLPASGANRAIYPGRVSNARTDFKTWVNEINLLSTGDSPLQWVVGAFYLDESVPVTLVRDNHAADDFYQSDSTIQTEAKNTSKSVFGQVNLRASEKVELIAGGRLSWDQQVYNIIASPGGIGTPVQKSNELTGKLGLNYFATDDTMLYATVSKGYKAGGVNLRIGDPNFLPEQNLVYELGVKSTLLDNRLRVNGDVFYSDYTDIQFASLGGIPPLPVTQNAASGKALGAELEILGVFGDFQINGGLGYLDGEFSRDVVLQNTVAGGNELVPKGRTLPFSPKWTINAGMQYEFHFDDMTLTPRLQYSHLSTQYATPFPNASTLVPGRDIVDARLTFQNNGPWRVEVFARNLFDETYIASQIQNSSSADGGIIYGAPRQYGVRLTVNFD